MAPTRPRSRAEFIAAYQGQAGSTAAQTPTGIKALGSRAFEPQKPRIDQLEDVENETGSELARHLIS